MHKANLSPLLGGEELRHKRKHLPKEELWEIIKKLEDRMGIYELEQIVRNLTLKDMAKALLLRGRPVIYVSKEVYESEKRGWKGLIFKRPYSERVRWKREERMTGGW